MRPVDGFVAADGTFFEKEADAEMHEAETTLSGLLALDRVSHTDRFLKLLRNHHVEVERYIRAYRAKQATNAEHPETSEDDTDQAYNEGREGDDESLFQQSVGSGEHVPDVGDSVEQEEVFDQRTVNGARGRERDARGVRGRENLATEERTEPSEARRRDRGSNIRKGSVGADNKGRKNR